MSTNKVRTGTETPRRARGRPRGFEPTEALDKARRVFLQKGFAAASLDDLAAATGLNRPSLYAAFGDKEQLYVLALRRYVGQLLAGLDAILAEDAPVAERMKRVFEAAIHRYCAPPVQSGCMLVSTATTESPGRPVIAAASAELVAEFDARFEKCFRRAIKAGELGNRPSARTRAHMANALLHTLAVRARTGTPPAELRSIAAAILPSICDKGTVP
jgi:AcrR family transcriptional regulator